MMGGKDPRSVEVFMVGDYWTKEQKMILKELHIDPLINSPKRLKKMVNYFRTPGASLWAVTGGMGLSMSASP